MTSVQLRDALRRGEVSATELVQTSLDRIEAASDLGAFVSVNAELALHEAREVDRRIAATPRDERHTLPPLLGLPTAHKDLVRVKGLLTTHGSAAVPHLVANADDPIAAAVRAAGAISLGKTQVPEFGIASYSENLVAPPARNPLDRTRTAGGSSGGTAAALRENLIPGAIGSDAGGSIRIPSGACGLVGLKPGRAVVPADASLGLLDDVGAPRTGVSGPMALTSEDAALWFDAIMGLPAGHEPAREAVKQAHDLTGLRVGVSFESPFDGSVDVRIDVAAMAAIARAATLLEDVGHRVENARITYDPRYPEAFTTVWTQALRRIALPADAEAKLGALATWFLTSARAATSEQVAQGVDALGDFARSATEQWARFDVVLTPLLAFDPPRIGDFWRGTPEDDFRLQCEWTPHTSMVNVAGVPAVAVPIELPWATLVKETPATTTLESSLPRGVQLIGKPGDEALLLQLAAQLAIH